MFWSEFAEGGVVGGEALLDEACDDVVGYAREFLLLFDLFDQIFHASGGKGTYINLEGCVALCIKEVKETLR